MADDPVNRWRRGLDEPTRATVDLLRSIVAGSHQGLSESIKWNAPSFALGDEDRITLGLERKGGVRLVLHRGAKQKASADFRFSDPDKLARWPAPDRGVIVFKDAEDVARRRDQLGALCARWLAATA
jgi:hypothetical protein